MNIIKVIRDTEDLAYAFNQQHPRRGIHLNLDAIRGYGPVVIELITLHELYHLLYDSSEEKAWKYAAEGLARLYFPLLPTEPVRKFFSGHRALFHSWEEPFVMNTIWKTALELHGSRTNT